MSLWWLLLIIPSCFMGGYITCGILSSNREADKCIQCKLKDKEAK